MTNNNLIFEYSPRDSAGFTGQKKSLVTAHESWSALELANDDPERMSLNYSSFDLSVNECKCIMFCVAP